MTCGPVSSPSVSLDQNPLICFLHQTTYTALFVKKCCLKMRGAVALLVLLFCVSGAWAQGESGGVKAELKELSNTVVKQKVEPRVTNTELQQRSRIKELKKENAALKVRLSASAWEVEDLKRENAALEARVTASERENTAFEARLSVIEREVEELENKKG
ncbi:uncharacterized protein [Salmo salar]|uniref:Uncharacterized protein n=1 Tax=Salmo salar TaxID=8030 RepID=A0A1S3QB95_SALSA|nr:uncharacterized protein LOC106590554 [Salmo salar]|eukprot:XP_014037137.1 PREDICTED: uncharacterized protein LOC106590554 [Salmo salar]